MLNNICSGCGGVSEGNGDWCNACQTKKVR
jgi:hypothetical protein